MYIAPAAYLMQHIPDNSVGMLMTDPPFHISIGRADNWAQARGLGADPWNNVTTVDDIIEWTKPHVEEAARILRVGGALVVMGGTQSLIGWDMCCPKYGLHWMNEVIVLWNTGKVRANNFGSLHMRVVWYCKTGLRHTFNSQLKSIYSNVLVCKKVPANSPQNPNSRRHPSEKPIGLTNFFISLLTKPGDLIVDPFMGSGSTLVSAVQCGRRYIGGDMDALTVQGASARLLHAEDEESAPISLWVNGKLQPILG